MARACAASTIAAFRGQGDIALGNVIGSNLFNVLGILGVTASVTPLPRGGVAWSTLGVMLAFALVLWPFALSQRRLVRLEGIALVAAYAGYIGWLAMTA